ncbi:hypothetical protein DQ04_04381030 [Trypanosoma grayi]|uniref:hypothetical protein n=1 Tax=Trypanosoma grayi TaxID=71804 RepID=UPI0004F4A86B|nr:hypothetical protein DQ04_04381030 [Trypanosoma grayi]KEG09961.1 hypothetical protein DQ04_04381030 [Trypanosoma grayi]
MGDASTTSSGGQALLPVISLTEGFVKCLHMPHKHVHHLRPVFACHVARHSSGVFHDTWLPRALIVTQTGHLVLCDTSDGRVTHEASLRFRKAPVDTTAEDEVGQPLVHVVLEQRTEKSLNSTLWMRISVDNSIFAAILRFHGPFQNLPLALIRVILHFVPKQHVSLQKYAQQRPLVKFIPKELCSLSSAKYDDGNSSPRGAPSTPRSSRKRYMAQVAVEERLRLRAHRAEMAEQQVAPEEGPAAARVTAEEVVEVPPHETPSPAPTTPRQEEHDKMEKSHHADADEEALLPLLAEEEEKPPAPLKASLLEAVVFSECESPSSPFDEERRRKERVEVGFPAAPFREGVDEHGARKEDMPSEEETINKTEEKVCDSKSHKHNDTCATSEVEYTRKDGNGNNESERPQSNDITASLQLTAPIVVSPQARKQRAVEQVVYKETSSRRSPSTDNVGHASTDTMDSPVDVLNNVELPPSPSPPPLVLGSTAGQVTNASALLTPTEGRRDATGSPPQQVTPALEPASVHEDPVLRALSANGAHILSTHTLQRPLADYRNNAAEFGDEEHRWRLFYQKNLGKKCEPRPYRNSPTEIYARGSTSPSRYRITGSTLTTMMGTSIVPLAMSSPCSP